MMPYCAPEAGFANGLLPEFGRANTGPSLLPGQDTKPVLNIYRRYSCFEPRENHVRCVKLVMSGVALNDDANTLNCHKMTQIQNTPEQNTPAKNSLAKRLGSVLRKLPFIGADEPLVSVIELNGVIGVGGGPASRRSIHHERFEPVIEAAFKPKGLKAVALSINSPGGSPVQSRMIFQSIRRHADKNKTPVLAFIEDVGASGGYLLAIAADEIYADGCSIVGSIGVISAGFGAHDALARLGLERRVYTAGTNKSTLDPFQPEKPDDIAHFKTVLDETHRQFVEMVKTRRGARLETDHDDTFTGRFWSAAGAHERGLIDGLAQLPDFLRERFGDDIKIKRLSPQGPSFLARLTGGEVAFSQAHRNPALLCAKDVATTLEERALWAQYGL